MKSLFKFISIICILATGVACTSTAQVNQKASPNQANEINKSTSQLVASVANRLKANAKLINDIWRESGVIGLTELTDTCYRTIQSKSYDCLTIDLGSKFINDSGPAPKFIEYFSLEEHRKRVLKVIASGIYKPTEVNLVAQMITRDIPKILLDELKSNGLKANPCIIIDPDISEHFSGECINNFASGYGVATGRDVYLGEFKNGYTHGYGKYIWGNQSIWATEEYQGWHYKGSKTGYGVLSIASNSQHPALESMKKYGTLIDGRYYAYLLFGAGKLIRHCQSEDICLSEYPTFDFVEIDNLIKNSLKTIGLADLQRLTKVAVERQSNRSVAINTCVTQELISDFFGDLTNANSIPLKSVADYYSFISNRRLVIQALLFCSN